MPQKVAGVEVTLSANSAKLLSELERSRKEVLKLRKTVDRSANRIKYAFNKIRRAAQVVASAFIVTALIKRVGAFVASIEMAQERIALMQARMQQFGRTSEAFVNIVRVSQDLGVTLDETAQGMTRLLIATRSLGSTSEELQNVQRNIVLLGRAGGTSAEEMRGALIQLTQGMASGRLQGEELRSVLENLPLVAMEIARHMGINIGLIRDYAKEGKILTQVIVEALQDVEVKMEDLPETFSMALARMANEWTLFASALGESIPLEGFVNQLSYRMRLFRMEVLDDFRDVSLEGLKRMYGSETDLDRLRKIAAEIEKRRQAEVKINEANEVRKDLLLEEINLLDLPKKKDSYFDNFMGQFQTYEEQIKSASRWLEIFKDQIIDLHGQEKYEQIKQSISEIGGELEEIDLNKLPRLRSTAQESFEDMSEFSKQAARNIQDAFADFLFDPFEDGLKGMLKSFLDTIRRMMANQLAVQFFKSTVGESLLDLFGVSGKRAAGGPVSGGATYLVGEKGPELFTAPNSGVIIPNHAIAGHATAVNYYIDARGADNSIFARLIPLLERTKEVTKSEIRQEQSQGRWL